jgi:hypothetical protein
LNTVKKVFGIGIVVLLAGALIGGTVYFLLRGDTGSNSGTASRNTGQNGEAGSCGQNNNTANSGGNRGGAVEGSGSGGGNGKGGAQNTGTSPVERQSITGTVLSLDHEMILQTGEAEMAIELGPEWYRETQPYSPQPGDFIQVTGFYENGAFQAVGIEDLASGRVLALRDENGRPMWSGRGRRGN